MAKLNVVILDVTGSKEQEAGLPDDVQISRVVERLVEVLHLPETNAAGVPIVYRLLHKPTGEYLREDITLADSVVKEGDVLRIMPEMTAGGKA